MNDLSAAETGRKAKPYTDAETLIRRIAEYEPGCDKDLVRRAYRFAEAKHSGQTRDSGDPYFSHPVAVAELLIDHKYGEHYVVTALLHDTIEDCDDVDRELIESEFGSDIAGLVQSVTNVSKGTQKPGFDLWLKNGGPPSIPVAKDFRDIVRILYDSAKDGRAMAVKLADRLHNMKTIHSCSPDKQKRIAIETLTVYAPLARSLGMHYWRKELENKAFKVLMPEKWKEMRRLYATVRGPKSERSVSYVTARRIEEDLRALMSRHNFDVTIKSRVKEPYSVWRKMEEHRITDGYQDWLLDVYGYQVIVNSNAPSAEDGEEENRAKAEAAAEVYRALCVIHSKWKAVPGRFKDYISSPKLNGYRSIHTTVAIEGSGNAEIQIRTDEMHREAEYGTAIHWVYRQQLPRNTWAREISDKWKEDLKNDLIKDVEKCEEHFKKQIEDSIICFNEKGHTVRLPKGSTAIDFAYLDDSKTGAHAGLVKIDAEFKDLGTALKHGQLVQIRKHNHRTVTPIWLNMTRSEDVRQMILHDLGMQELETEFGAEHQPTEELLDKAAVGLKFSDSEEMVSWLGSCVFDQQLDADPAQVSQPSLNPVPARAGKPARKPITARQILQHALPEEHKRRETELRNSTMAMDIEMDGGKNPEIARCCMPLPGEMVVGLLDSSGDASLHAVDCPELSNESAASMKWSDVSWRGGTGTFLAGFIVQVTNSVGALGKLCEAVGRQNTNISDMIFLTRSYSAFDIFFEVQVRNREHLANIMVAVSGEQFAKSVVRCRNLDAVKGRHRVTCSSDQPAAH